MDEQAKKKHREDTHVRESKFRAWIPQAKEWIYDISLKDLWLSGQAFEAHGTSRYEAENIQGVRWTFDDLVFVEFIGLKDKDGKEIYEGDIVSTLSANPHYRGPVKFGVRTISPDADGESRMAGFYLDAEAVGASEYITDHMCRGECVIVGNIYENPELINED